MSRSPSWLPNTLLAASIGVMIALAGWSLGGRAADESAGVVVEAADDLMPSLSVPLDDAAVLGAPLAALGIIVFSDFECPFCGAFARDVMPTLKERYIESGKVQMAFRHLPLTAIHPFAVRAAETAECAGRVGAFWPVHDALFARPRLNEEFLMVVAAENGVSPDELAACRSEGVRIRIADDSALAYELGISTTPTFLFGTIEKSQAGNIVRVTSRLSGFQPFEAFDAVLQEMSGSVGSRR